ncbi:hypothetical protein KAU19_08280 [Candidatus Parcubacteria bacterium]|nr:hypothetical protein [Candidatus Parcubacteria bacterium]
MIIKKGDKYGKLIAINFSHKKKRIKYWLFKCDCGNKKVICVSSVKRGDVQSCGCLWKEKMIKHRMSRTKTYKSWGSMKQRCLNKNAPNYKNWGGRGITICEEWLSDNGFQNFYKDMGNAPQGLSLDRIDNNLGYCKENCRWATREKQQNNTRCNRLLTLQGRTQTIPQWARELNINYNTLYNRIYKGWSVERALKI